MAKRISAKEIRSNPPGLLASIMEDIFGGESPEMLAEALKFHFNRAESLAAKLLRVRKTHNETVVQYRRVKKGFKTHQKARSVRLSDYGREVMLESHTKRRERWVAANPELAAKWPEKVAVA